MAIVNDSTIRPQRSLNISATASGEISTTVFAGSLAAAGGATAGAAAGAGVTATNEIQSETIAVFQDSDGSDFEDGNLNITTQNSSQIHSEVESATLAVAAGSYAGGVSVAISETSNVIENKLHSAILRSTVQDGVVHLSSFEQANVNSIATAGAVAAAASPAGVAIAGGGAIATSKLLSSVNGEILNSDVSGRGAIIESQTYGDVNASTQATVIAAGLIGIGASGSVAHVESSPIVSGTISGTTLDVDATSMLVGDNVNANANAAGLTVSSGLAVGVSKATTKHGSQVNTIIDSAGQNQFHVGGLVAWAIGSISSAANAQGSTGGLLVGVNATQTSIDDERVFRMEIADNSVIDADYVSMTSSGAGVQNAQSSSVTSAGLAAAGVTNSSVTSNIQSTTRIGKNVEIESAEHVRAWSTNDIENNAHSVAGAVANASAAVATSETENNSTSLTQIDDGASIIADEHYIQFDSTNLAVFDSTLFAAAGGFLSGTGGILRNEVDANSLVDIGDAVMLTAPELVVYATNKVEKQTDRSTGNVDATAGGLVAGVGVDSQTIMDLQAKVDFGANSDQRDIRPRGHRGLQPNQRKG